MAAIEAARSGPVEEGSVGGGTGMNCYQFKGGSGTASRIVDELGHVLHGRRVRPGQLRRPPANWCWPGCRSASDLADDNPMGEFRLAPPGAGSVIAVVATDAPLFPHQCQALARRVTAGLARTGTSGSHFSGDLFLAFSDREPGRLPARSAEALSRLSFVPWEKPGPVLRGRRAGHRGSRGQRAGRERGHDRARRASHPGPAARPGHRAAIRRRPPRLTAAARTVLGAAE